MMMTPKIKTLNHLVGLHLLIFQRKLEQSSICNFKFSWKENVFFTGHRFSKRFWSCFVLLVVTLIWLYFVILKLWIYRYSQLLVKYDLVKTDFMFLIWPIIKIRWSAPLKHYLPNAPEEIHLFTEAQNMVTEILVQRGWGYSFTHILATTYARVWICRHLTSHHMKAETKSERQSSR